MNKSDFTSCKLVEDHKAREIVEFFRVPQLAHMESIEINTMIDLRDDYWPFFQYKMTP